MQPWDQVKTIGLLYILDSEADFNKLNQIILKLRSEQKTVKALCLFSGKELPSYCKILEEYDYFNKKDLNWYGKPKGITTSRFILQKFDLLANLDVSENQSFDYVLGHSKAKLKAGIRRKEMESYYDLMMDVETESDNESLLELIIDWIKRLCPAKS
jgi:hypothetical protein